MTKYYIYKAYISHMQYIQNKSSNDILHNFSPPKCILIINRSELK